MLLRCFFLFISLFVSQFSLSAQVISLPAVRLSRYGIGAANFSGITRIDSLHYALVSDKAPQEGYYLFSIQQDAHNGSIQQVQLDGYRSGSPLSRRPTVSHQRDEEGIAYVPSSSRFFIAGEFDQRILEYLPSGTPTGRSLHVPALFSSAAIAPNLGFESLCYDSFRQRIWTTTESFLPADGIAAQWSSHGPFILCFQSFDNQLCAAEQYAYPSERGQLTRPSRLYAFGVADMCALPDGRWIVLEREINIRPHYWGSTCVVQLFLVDASATQPIDSTTSLSHLAPHQLLSKHLLYRFRTSLHLFRNTLANYEGICLGRRLADGRQTLLLISDSQQGAGKGPIHLQDYLKVIILPAHL